MEDVGNEIFMGSFKKRGDPEFFIMDETECYDIDYPWQFEIAEALYGQRVLPLNTPEK
jgi:CMP-N-acetylneuraminic acid synthetase